MQMLLGTVAANNQNKYQTIVCKLFPIYDRYYLFGLKVKIRAVLGHEEKRQK